MNLAVFARGLGRQPTGRGIVAWRVLDVLRRRRPEWKLLLLSGEDPGWEGVEWKPGKGAGLLGDAWRVLRGAAGDIRSFGADAVWSATHFLPRGLPDRLPKIATLLDVVWRDHPETMDARNRRVASRLERGLHDARRILCISEFTRGRLETHWPDLSPRARVMLLAPNPDLRPDLNPSAALRELGLDGPFVLNVDTIEPRKNLGVYLDCAERHRNVLFVQCGGVGWNVDSLLERARRLANVRLLSYVGDAHLNALYLAARAAVFPSIYEGFHLPPLDALALGCPVLASDIPVHREVLGDAAEYAPPCESGAFASRLGDILGDESRRARLSTAGPARAGEFSWARAAETLIETVESTVRGRGA